MAKTNGHEGKAGSVQSIWKPIAGTLIFLALAILAFYVSGGNASLKYTFISASLLFASCFLYGLLVIAVMLGGGVDEKDEERMLYTAIMGIAIVLFAAISQLHIGLVGTVATLGAMVIIAISVVFRFASHLNRLKAGWSSAMLVAISWIFIIFAAVLGFYLLAFTPLQSQQIYPPAVNQSGLVPGSTCNSFNESSNQSIVTCSEGQNSTYGFKLLAVSPASAQILIYDDCSACLHTSTNGNNFVAIMNVSVGQAFGGGCGSAYPSRLLYTNANNYVAIFEVNQSFGTICI